MFHVFKDSYRASVCRYRQPILLGSSSDTPSFRLGSSCECGGRGGWWHNMLGSAALLRDSRKRALALITWWASMVGRALGVFTCRGFFLDCFTCKEHTQWNMFTYGCPNFYKTFIKGSRLEYAKIPKSSPVVLKTAIT